MIAVKCSRCELKKFRGKVRAGGRCAIGIAMGRRRLCRRAARCDDNAVLLIANIGVAGAARHALIVARRNAAELTRPGVAIRTPPRADDTRTHDQNRDQAMGALPREHRRALHGKPQGKKSGSRPAVGLLPRSLE